MNGKPTGNSGVRIDIGIEINMKTRPSKAKAGLSIRRILRLRDRIFGMTSIASSLSVRVGDCLGFI